MNFKNWLENNQQLATQFRDLLHNVPQEPDHHPEGDALIHTKLVRKAIPKAILELRELKKQPPFDSILADLDFYLDDYEYQILTLAAWLHDIGKSTATAIKLSEPDSVNRLPFSTYADPVGKITSYGHDEPEHYLPAIEKLKKVAPPKMLELYERNKDLIHFLIDYHMAFYSNVGFPKKFIEKYFSQGKARNTQELKLLLILMWSDKMGRKPENKILDSLKKNAQQLVVTSDRSKKMMPTATSKAFEGSPEEMNKFLKTKPLTPFQRFQAIKRKFPMVSDEQLQQIVGT